MAPRAPAGRRAGGFTYLGLIILVAIIGLVGAASLKIGALLQRAAAEEELLDAGAAFSDALKSYAAATPPGQPPQPPTLQDLLRDPRFPGMRRHLRKIFVDPITGTSEWGVMYLGDRVGVIGVHSLSQAPPLKISNFDVRFHNFENKEHLSDWKFTLTGQLVLPTPAPKPAGQPLTPEAAPGAEPMLAVPAEDPGDGQEAATEAPKPDEPKPVGEKR